MKTLIKTPESHPDDPAVGHYFAAPSFERERIEIFFCESFDSNGELHMTNVNHPEEHREVLVHALGRTWAPAEDRGDHWWVAEWNARIDKASIA